MFTIFIAYGIFQSFLNLKETALIFYCDTNHPLMSCDLILIDNFPYIVRYIVMASRKRPHDSTNGINHDLEGIEIRNGDSNSSSVPDTLKYRSSSSRPVS